MKFFNPDAARYLTDVPIEDLIKKLDNYLIDSGQDKIKRNNLRNFLIQEIPILIREIPRDKTIKYPDIGKMKQIK